MGIIIIEINYIKIQYNNWPLSSYINLIYFR